MFVVSYKWTIQGTHVRFYSCWWAFSMCSCICWCSVSRLWFDPSCCSCCCCCCFCCSSCIRRRISLFNSCLQIVEIIRNWNKSLEFGFTMLNVTGRPRAVKSASPFLVWTCETSYCQNIPIPTVWTCPISIYDQWLDQLHFVIDKISGLHTRYRWKTISNSYHRHKWGARLGFLRADMDLLVLRHCAVWIVYVWLALVLPDHLLCTDNMRCSMDDCIALAVLCGWMAGGIIGRKLSVYRYQRRVIFEFISVLLDVINAVLWWVNALPSHRQPFTLQRMRPMGCFCIVINVIFTTA